MNNNSYTKDIVMQGIARVFGGLLSFFAVFVLTYLFDEDTLGKYNLVLTTINIITSVCTLWLSQSVLRYYQSKEQLGAILLLSLICALFSLLFFEIYISLTGTNRCVWAYFYVIILVLYNLVDAIFRKGRRLLYYVGLELLLAIGRLFPMVIIVKASHDYNSIFLSQFITVGAFLIIAIFREKTVIMKTTYKVDRADLVKYLRFGLPLVGLSISNWFLTSSDRYIIRILGSDSQVGIYSTNYSLGNSIYMMFALILVNAMHPIIINLWDKNHSEAVKTVSRSVDLYLIMMTPLVFYGTLKSHVLLSLFKGTSYSEHSSVFIWTILGIYLYGISLFLHKYYECEQQTNSILLMNLVSAVFNIIMNVLLIPHLGFEVAALTTFLSYFLYIIMVLCRTHRLFPVRINSNNLAKIILSIVVFWVIDLVFIKNDSILLFFIEGFIYVIYTLVFYQLFKIYDLKSLLKSTHTKKKRANSNSVYKE